MSVAADTVKLLRIPFSLLLMPVFLLAVSQSPSADPVRTLICFLIIHLLVYPSSNGYNSYVDRDTTSIGGLERPPLPTPHLFRITIVMDALALILAAWLVSPLFAGCLLLYILASRAYSAPQPRLKKYAFAGFATVVIFQGAFTYFMTRVGISAHPFPLPRGSALIMTACSFQIAGAYPLTQIYQHEADLKDGVRTLSCRLGYRGTFLFTASMFAVCNLFYWLYFSAAGHPERFYWLQLFFLPVVAYFLWWFMRVNRDRQQANFKNAMQMNLIAAGCMNACFIFLIVANHLN